jgi:hypothetical protein
MGPPSYESGTRPSQRYRSYVYVQYDKNERVPGCAKFRPTPRDVIVDVGVRSGMGKIRHDHKPSFTHLPFIDYSTAGNISLKVKKLQVSFPSASLPVHSITHFSATLILKASFSEKEPGVANRTFLNSSPSFNPKMHHRFGTTEMLLTKNAVHGFNTSSV